MKLYLYEEDDLCPVCKQSHLSFKPDKNLFGCSCHLGHAPCAYCTSKELTCSNCNVRFEETKHGYFDGRCFWLNNELI